jgi:hypothetical protein
MSGGLQFACGGQRYLLTIRGDRQPTFASPDPIEQQLKQIQSRASERCKAAS